MVRVIKSQIDPDAHAWLTALIGLSKAERRSTLKDFCRRCSIDYRFLYAVLQGRSAISAEVLETLTREAARVGIDEAISVQILRDSLGVKN